MGKFLKRTAILCISIFILSPRVLAAELIPVGEVIGIQLSDGSVTVAEFDEDLGQRAKAAGLQVGDIILRVDDEKVTCAQDIRHSLERCDGVVELTVLRDGKEKQLRLQPQVTKDGPKLGVYLKQGITGVGTVTWYDPETGSFGALGHGVNDPNGSLLKMEHGTAYRAAVQSVKKGMVGEPGQLVGVMPQEQPIGVLLKNTSQGIFGKTESDWQGRPFPVAAPEEVATGAASIYSTVRGEQVQEYSVEILKIYPKADASGRNMLIKVTDPALLAATGGIVQGMGVSYNRDNPEKTLACKGFWR